nr:MAG TPA: hypothetical protein [Caudoviricetes sp.]DAQ16111.1 MAG TPA: hypothetical protein [Caudoviricetes sp.]
MQLLDAITQSVLAWRGYERARPRYIVWRTQLL